MLLRLFSCASWLLLIAVAIDGGLAAAMSPPPGAVTLPGREADGRVAAVAFRLATHGLAHCPDRIGASGIVLQHLSQFEAADRAGLAAAWRLDRGPGVMALVPDSPGERAGLRNGDVLLAVDDMPLPPEPGLDRPFDAAAALRRADLVASRLAQPRPHRLTVARGEGVVALVLQPVPACPSDVRLARSGQRNAFADGRHATITTGLLARLGNDDQLAFLIAHEMAHNILGHDALVRSGADARPLERAADALGAKLMVDAGFDPLRGVAALDRAGGFHLPGAHTHDDTRTRTRTIHALVAGTGDRDRPPAVGGAGSAP